MIRLVAFDLDGTLVDGYNHVSKRSYETVQAIVDHDVMAASLSGRNVEKSQMPFEAFPDLAKGLYVGSYNGAVVLGPEIEGCRKVLGDKRLETDVFRDVGIFVASKGLNFIYCKCEVGPNGVLEQYYADRETASTRGLAKLTGVAFVFDVDLAENVQSGSLKPPPKMIVMPGEDGQKSTLVEMQERFGDNLYLARTGTDRIEIMHPEVNKAEALQTIANACGLEMSEVLAIGDGDNDLPMLKSAGLGVLMGNADEKTKSSAGKDVHQAPAFDEEGFSKAIHRFVLNGKSS